MTVPRWSTKPGETPIDPSGLLDRSIRSRKQLNAAEAKNIAEVVYKYLLGGLKAGEAPFDFAWVLELHREMFGRVWVWAGKPRQLNLNLGCPWHEVETRLHELLLNVAYWNGLPSEEQAARLHHGAVSIHPFENGNGRWARMLANIWLKRHGKPPTLWPEEAVAETSIIRDEYLAAVRAADAMDFVPLTALHAKYAAAE